MSSRRYVMLAVTLLAVGCATTGTRPAPFRARPDSVAAGDLRGPFQGRIVDIDTGRPVAGALVQATWTYVEGSGLQAPVGFVERIASTDANGGYQIDRVEKPGGTRGGGDGRLAAFRLVVYKKGYVAYRSDRRFDDFGTRLDFAQRNLVIRLEPWRSDLSHARHLRYVGGGPALAALTAWEVPEAAAELASGASLATEDAATRPAAEPTAEAPVTPALVASKLLTPADVSRITGQSGSFDVKPLTDEPSSASYDSTHLRARNQPESYDVALRVWLLDLGDAQQQYGKLLAELPNVQEKNEIADRSLRATSENRDILGLAFLDGRRGIVALVTCGASQCKTYESVVELGRLIHERAQAMLGGTQ